MDQNFSSFQNYQPGEDQEIPFVQIKNAAYFRAKARGVLKGKFVNVSVMALLYFLIAVGISFVSGLISGIVLRVLGYGEAEIVGFKIADIVSVIISFLGLFATAPLTIGYYRLLLDTLDGKIIETENLFSRYQKGYWSSVKYLFLYNLLSCACLLPAVASEVAVWFMEQSIDITVGWGYAIQLSLRLVCYIVSMVLVIGFVYRYSMAHFILAEYPEMRAVDVMRSSAAMMKGRKWRLFCLHVSFIGWFFVLAIGGTLTCLIGLLVGIFPFLTYVLVSHAAFYDDAANREAARQAEFPSLDPDDYTFASEDQSNENKD
ncbi:MAG: DUF975 family protein [Ruminococcaceae bacterium]|nr:DUF975 family protein [Oscillospiraceae bacterium]